MRWVFYLLIVGAFLLLCAYLRIPPVVAALLGATIGVIFAVIDRRRKNKLRD